MNERKKILLVEDRESDARLVVEAFKGVSDKCDFEIIKDGEDAIKHLARIEKDPVQGLPDIIILDIKLPKRNGKEILKEVKSSVTLSPIPVIMLTNSDSKADILDSYEHKANTYITKPLSMEELVDTAKFIKDTWLNK